MAKKKKISDPLNIWNGRRWKFTLKNICEIIGAEIPEEFKSRENDLISSIRYHKFPSEINMDAYDGLFFDKKKYKRGTPAYDKVVRIIKAGAIVFSPVRFVDENGAALPSIPLADAFTKYCMLGRYMKDAIPMPTVAITGSVGKSTTVAFAETVFNEKYNVYNPAGASRINKNGPNSVVRTMMGNYSPKYNFHVQEAGAGAPGLVEGMAKLLNVDAYAITNIDTGHHVKDYGSIEAMIYDKASFDRIAKENAFGVINIDDPFLKEWHFENRIVTIGIDNQDAQYRALNVKQDGELLEFDVSHLDELTHIAISIPGKHNVYNALIVFAMAHELGLSNAKIASGFAKYTSVGIRQAVYDASGRVLYMDCFSGSSRSIITGCEAAAAMKEDGAKCLAVIGGEGRLGDQEYNVNFQTGATLGKMEGIDHYVVIGPATDDSKATNIVGNGKALFNGLLSVNPTAECTFVTTHRELADVLRRSTAPGDVVLLEGGHHTVLYAGADLAFGTQFAYNDASLVKRIVKNEDFTGRFVDCVNGLEISGKSASRNVTLPDTIEGLPVISISSGNFSGNPIISTVSFGSNLNNISAECFKNCIGLTRLDIPSGVIRINDSAFAGCINIKEAKLESVEHIGKYAFSGCKSLRHIKLSEKCLFIDETAFEGCGRKLVISAPKGSYAYSRVAELGLNTRKGWLF